MEQRKSDPIVIAAILAPFLIIGIWITTLYMNLK